MTPLDKGQLTVMRVHAAFAALLLLAVGAAAERILHERIGLMFGAILLPLLPLLLWTALVVPARRFRAWGYRMSVEELHVRRGSWTRTETFVPIDRVEHIDIAQGPLERACGVSRLIVHTAGTLHSQIVLPGLPRPVAEAMRDEIRARIRRQGR